MNSNDSAQFEGETCEHQWHGIDPCPFCRLDWTLDQLSRIEQDLNLVAASFPFPINTMLIKLHDEIKRIMNGNEPAN